MNKSILVLNTPENCCKCPLNNNYFCNATNNCTLKYVNDRPNWCPLRPVPERYEDVPCDGGSLSDMSIGWNNCIDEILGG